ncbi:baseplate J/gp47 family protein [Tissierella praeacuta]|uniref:baseplate J/gp47 family protein n=1 Tax=Tissierella praeacuta TaxID=43131 RepID=UPI003DA29398
MNKFGVTVNGFKRKTYNDILNNLQARAREVFGNDMNLSNTSFLGMWLQNEAWEIAELWELAEDVYYSAFIDYNEGTSQDNTGKYITISRKPAQKSKGTITVEGKEGTRILKGFRVGNEQLDIIFETTENAVIGSTGTIDIPITSVNAGLNQNVPANTLTKVVNPIIGVNKVYNKDITVDGTDTETDAEFRERYYRSTSKGGSSTRESVEAAILDIENVTDAFVEENETMEYIDDIPPKSLAPYVFGGEDGEIAKVILKSKAGGIRSYGLTQVLVTDSQGIEHTIGFTRPVVKDIYVRLNIARDKGYLGDNVVTRAVLNYIGGEDAEGISYKGLKLGEDVVISKIMASVMCLQGIKDIEVEISLDDITYQSTNVEIAKKEIAKTKFDKVVINYVE